MGNWEPHEGVVQLRDGRRLRGTGIDHGRADLDPPELAIYLLDADPGQCPWEHQWVRWPDFDVPNDTEEAVAALRVAFARSLEERVEVACNGGVGRTGTALALLAIMAGTRPDDAVVWVRRHYHPDAIETPGQIRWLSHAAVLLADLGGAPSVRPTSE